MFETLRFQVAAGESDHPRLGLAVPRRAGNAVERNRIKRWIRHAFLDLRERLGAVDIVASPNFHRLPQNYENVRADLTALADRLQGTL